MMKPGIKSTELLTSVLAIIAIAVLRSLDLITEVDASLIAGNAGVYTIGRSIVKRAGSNGTQPAAADGLVPKGMPPRRQG